MWSRHYLCRFLSLTEYIFVFLCISWHWRQKELANHSVNEYIQYSKGVGKNKPICQVSPGSEKSAKKSHFLGEYVFGWQGLTAVQWLWWVPQNSVLFLTFWLIFTRLCFHAPGCQNFFYSSDPQQMKIGNKSSNGLPRDTCFIAWSWLPAASQKTEDDQFLFQVLDIQITFLNLRCPEGYRKRWIIFEKIPRSS